MRGRRRNPDYLNIALLGAIGVGLYVLYTTLKGGASAAATAIPSAFSSASSKVADLLQQILPNAANTVFPAGTTIVLGTGQEIPASAAAGVGQFTDVDNTQKFQFYYAGQTWRTTAATPDDTNTFYATAFTGPGS